MKINLRKEEKLNKIIIRTFFVMILFLFVSCFSRWSDKEKKEFECNCNKTEHFDNLLGSVTGYKFTSNDSILVVHCCKNITVDSFYIKPEMSSYDDSRCRYSIWIKKRFYTKDIYKFIISPTDTFILSDMKMIMWAQWTQTSDNYGCIMGDYKINGIRFAHNGNPDFKKKGFKFLWEK